MAGWDHVYFHPIKIESTKKIIIKAKSMGSSALEQQQNTPNNKRKTKGSISKIILIGLDLKIVGNNLSGQARFYFIYKLK